MTSTFQAENFKKHFPIFHKPLNNGKPLIYFDNSATTQKPQCVIDRIVDFYANYNSNVHRGMYELSERATHEYEQARTKAANYLGVKNPSEIIFVKGTTEAINLVANSYVKKFLHAGDEILVGAAEHHANYLPWQVLEQEKGIVRKIIPLDKDFNIDTKEYEKLFSSKTKFVSIQHISNVLGAVNDIKKLTDVAHANGAKILIDGACSLAFERVNLYEIGCDFFACSGHKGFAPMGSGILFGKYELLEQMPPYQTGGNAVNHVSFDSANFKLPPDRFEPGTPDVASIIGLGQAIDFLSQLDWRAARQHLTTLTEYAKATLQEQIPSATLYGTPKTCIISFNLRDIHSHDIATYLGNEGIAVRAGTHCAQPLMKILKTPGTIRFSLSLYNSMQEIDIAVGALSKCQKLFF